MSDAHLLPRFREVVLDYHEKPISPEVEKALRESATVAEEELKANPYAAAGDPQRLRGLPAIGRSVPGAIAGTLPHVEAMRRSKRQRSRRKL